MRCPQNYLMVTDDANPVVVEFVGNISCKELLKYSNKEIEQSYGEIRYDSP